MIACLPSPAERPAKAGINPKTGEEAPISKGKTIKFKPGKEFKNQLKTYSFEKK